MTTQRYVVVVGAEDSTATRVFGPMNARRAEEFRDGLRARHPNLPIAARPCERDTYDNAVKICRELYR